MIIVRSPNYSLSSRGSLGQVVRRYSLAIGNRMTPAGNDRISVSDLLHTPPDLLAKA